MNKDQVLWLLLLIPLFPYPCGAQGMMEYGSTQAGVAGLGAGLAASLHHGKVIRHSYQAAINAQQALIMQSTAVEQYMKTGCELEARKNWAAAEESFTYVLKVIARRDGPGSSKSLPALEHLVSVTQAQDKIEDAIKYQETVIAFEKAAPSLNLNAVVKAQNNLSNLFVTRGDYASAEPLLRDSVAICNSHRSALSSSQRHNTVVSYSKVLRKLNKNAEAETIETEDKRLKDEEDKGLAEDKTLKDQDDKTLAKDEKVKDQSDKILTKAEKVKDQSDKILTKAEKDAQVSDLVEMTQGETAVSTRKVEQSVPTATITPQVDQH